MDRPYLFAELTNSLCAHCLRKVEAKAVLDAMTGIVFDDDKQVISLTVTKRWAETGSIKVEPKDWKEMYFPGIHDLPGS